MPTDMQKLMQNKETIINIVQSKGPSLPVQIAREANLGLLFASAYLSELYNEQKIKMSNMKVGSSPLYYLEGQEPMLENFVQYLNQKEKEALNLLKSSKILEDEKVEPAIRVALRSIKDFAVPIKIKIEEEPRLFWKHFLVKDSDVKGLLELFTVKKEKKARNEEKDRQETLVSEQLKRTEQEMSLKKTESGPAEKEEIEKLKEKIEQISREIKKPEINIEKEKSKKIRIKKAEESKFVGDIKAYLISKDIELLSVIEEKKKELTARIRIDTMFGKQELLLIAKEKKKVSEEDITIALHKAQLEKMPALFLAPGEVDKKAGEHAKLWRNLVKFEKVKS